MSRSLPWHAIVGCGRPATAREERAFIAELAMRATAREKLIASGQLPTRRRASSFNKDRTWVPGTDVDYDIVVLVVNTLRSGVPASALLDLAVGCDPEEMVTAYQLAKERLAHASTAWQSLLDCAAAGVWVGEPWASAAEQVMPVGVNMLRTSGEQRPELMTAAASIAASVAAARAQASGTEYLLDHPSLVKSGDLTSVGRRLYDPYFGALWHDPLFLPVRVGELTPDRLAGLIESPPVPMTARAAATA